MPCCDSCKKLEEKYTELLRAFKSLNTKVNNNYERNGDKFIKLEKGAELLEKRIEEVKKLSDTSIKELEQEKAKVDKDLESVEEKLNNINHEISNLTERQKDTLKNTNTTMVSKPKVKHLYKCAKCHKHFETSRLLRIHMSCDHEICHKCSHCDLSFKTSSELEMHLSDEHENTKFSCDKCDTKFIMKWRLKKHQRIHDDFKTRNCHFFNSDKFCPFSKIGCKFKHQYSVDCKYAEKCEMDKCQFRHRKIQQDYPTGSFNMNCDEL